MPSFPDLLETACKSVEAITPETLRARLASSDASSAAPVLLDVRAGFEFESGAILGALHLPEARVDAEVESLIVDKEREVLLYCSGITRAALAGAVMQELGYARVRRLAPGFSAWRRLGFPTTSPVARAPGGVEWSTRYAKHLALEGVGVVGQEKLSRSRVLIVGAGGLGSPAALYLAAAGVGTLGVCDADTVDLTNLQRQIVHTTSRVGRSKVSSARETLLALNPTVRVVPIETLVDAENVHDVIDPYDLVVDGTDNLAARYVLSDACFTAEKPLVFGAVHQFDGQVSVFGQRAARPEGGLDSSGRWLGPCYRCLVPEAGSRSLSPRCDEVGVLGALPGLIGTLQAVEALKLILGIGQSLVGRVLLVDALTMRFTDIRLRSDPSCPTCTPQTSNASSSPRGG